MDTAYYGMAVQKIGRAVYGVDHPNRGFSSPCRVPDLVLLCQNSVIGMVRADHRERRVLSLDVSL